MALPCVFVFLGLLVGGRSNDARRDLFFDLRPVFGFASAQPDAILFLASLGRYF